MNLNDFAAEVTKVCKATMIVSYKRGKKYEVNIAQAKNLVKAILTRMAAMSPGEVIVMLKRYQPRGKKR